jgi:transcription elongation factor GreA
VLLAPLKTAGRSVEQLTVIRRLVDWRGGDLSLRADAIDALRRAYAGRPGFETFLKLSGLTGSGDLGDGLTIIEEYLDFSPGRHVHHDGGWGTGRVFAVDGETGEIVVDFVEEKAHRFPPESARKFLLRIPDDHIWALRYSRLEEMRALAENDPAAIIRIVLKSFKGKSSLANIKNELCGDILPLDKWTRWWSKARTRAAHDPYIELGDGGARSILSLREKPIGYAEEVADVVESASSLTEAVSAARVFLKRSRKEAGPLVRRISARLGAEAPRLLEEAPWVVAETLLFLDSAGEEPPATLPENARSVRRILQSTVQPDAAPAVGSRSPFARFLAEMEIVEYRKDLLDVAREAYPEEWPRLFADLLTDVNTDLWDAAVDGLEDAGKSDVLTAALVRITSDPSRYREPFLSFAKSYFFGKRFGDLSGLPTRATVIEKLFLLYEMLSRGKGGEDPASTKRTMARMESVLVDKKRGAIPVIFPTLPREDANQLYVYSQASRYLSTEIVDSVRVAIARKFPDLLAGRGKPFWESESLYVTEAALRKAEEDYRHLVNVRIPENSKAIGRAAALGDLSENSEYTAALEEQRELTSKAERVKKDLQRARTIENEVIATDVVMPGTRVFVRLIGDTKEESFVILGPWDADSERGIVSYVAPIGQGLLGRKPGDVATVTLPDKQVQYEVIRIERAL